MDGAPQRGMTPMKTLTKAVTGLAALLLFLSACETTEGFGRDVEDAGEAIEDAADGDD